ncbi:hypothetical protein PoB_004494600 [Plakobranchus ocellatus]|uniref:Uncharacterized protein n=1 Tax=Plakobranchus ocellatus TaxID=259542 RepID=A0AAV4BDE5_9GAST|nr:hypothetical protein PoB_004494600 [Plakobranchus ocellatus]
MADPDIVGQPSSAASDNAREPYVVSAEDINRYILFNQEPISTTLSIWSKYAPEDLVDDQPIYIQGDDFGYTADLQFLHKECNEDTGTLIQYTADIDNVNTHVMTI